MDTRPILAAMAVAIFFAFWGTSSLAAEKLRYSTSVKGVPSYEVPMVAAEERGIWAKHGLEAEWIPFRSSADLGVAVTTGKVDMGTMETITSILFASRGIPNVLVASLNQRSQFYVWVRADSPMRAAADLKGTRVAAVSLHGLTAAYARLLKKALGLEFKLVGIGGYSPGLASLKAGTIDAMVTGGGVTTALKVKGEIRDLLSLEQYVPKPWNEYHIYAHKVVAKENPGLAKRTIQAVLEAGDFVRENRRWAIELMKKQYGSPEQAASLVFEESFAHMGGAGKVNPKGIENVKSFMVEYNLVAKDKAPKTEEVFTSRFVE